MGGMFSGCSKLTEIDVSGFDTSNVTDMYEMFSGCSSLTKLDLSNFDTGKVTAIREMFKDCSRLTSLDLSSFDAGNLSQDTYHYEGVLSGCNSLTQLYTPRNLKENIALEGTWYDMAGNSYTALPKEQTNSMLLYRKISSSEGAGRLTAKKETTAYFCGDTLNTQDLTVIYYNASGEAKKLTQMEYSTNEADINMNTAGTYTLTVTYQPPEGVSLTADILLTVKKKFEDTCVTVTLPGADSYSYVYDGSRKNPSPVVTYTEDGKTLTLEKKTDYTVSYKNNINPYKDGADAAENAPTVTVTGRGTYGGQVAKTFEIRKAAAPENEELTYEVTNFSSPQTVRIPLKDSFQGYKKVSCTVGTPVENDEISGSILAGTPTTDSSMRLTCSLNAGTAGDFVTIPVTVSFDNYEDAVLNVKIIFTGTPAAEKKKVTISGIEIKNSVYNKVPISYTGTAKVVSQENNADLTGTVKLTYTYSGTQADGTAYAATQNAPVNAGSYKLTVAVAPDDKNYTGSVEYPFTIAKAPLTITARDMGLKIGAELPKAEDYQFDIAGLLEGDTLITNPTLSCSIADTTAAGEYDITVSGADAGMNYDITYKNGTLTVSETGETAKYYTVIFNLSGKGSDITNTGVKEGSLLEQPREPQAEGYIFTGWYKDQACTVRWDFATDTVQADTVIYAGWKKKDADPDDEEDASWHISEIAPAVYTGNAIKPAVTVYDSDGTLLKAGTYYTIAYKNNTEADRVAAAGGTGSAEDDTAAGFNKELPYVVITGKGNYQGTIYRNFHINPASISDDGETPAKGFTLKYTEQFVTANKEQKPFTSIKYKKAMTVGKDYDIAFSKYAADGSLQEITSGSAVPAISANDAGTFRLVITGKGSFSGTIEKDIYVGSKDSLMKNAKITVGKDIKSVPYTGADIEPKASGENGTNVFTVKIGSKFLTPETDYTVSYRNNRAAGTATIIVKGKGQYIGTKSAAFTIKGTPFKAKDAAVKNFEASRIYTGSAIEQGRDGVTIGGKTLNYGMDYTTAYKNNVKKGTATVTFVANPESGYSGSFNKTFKITAADLSAAAVEFSDYTVTGTGSERRLDKNVPYSKDGAKPAGSLRLTGVNGRTLQNGTDYTISYADNKKAGAEAVMSIKGKGNYTGKITVKYTVGKASLDGNERLAQTCTPMVFNTAKADSYLYKPKFKLMDGKKALSAKTDYKQLTNESYINCTQDKVKAYLDALESGTVTGTALADMKPCVIIEAADNGNYMGSTKVYLTIYKTKLTKNVLDVQITGGDIYTGKQVTPTVTVKLRTDGKTLAEGRDYTLSYGANTAAGRNKGSVTVSGSGLYGGSVTVKFDIKSKDINRR